MMQSLKNTHEADTREPEIRILVAAPGQGKTEALVNHLASTAKPSLVIAPSMKLVDSISERLRKAGVACLRLHTDAPIATGRVAKDLSHALNRREPVIVCTHSAFKRFNRADLLRGYDLFIDELPELCSFSFPRFSGEDKREIFEYLDFISLSGGVTGCDKLLRLKPRLRRKLERTLEARRTRSSDGWSPAKAALLQCALEGGWIYCDQTSSSPNDVSCFAWFLLDDAFRLKILAADTATILAASYAGSLTDLIFRYWGFNKLPAELRFLPRHFDPKPMTIYPLLHRASRRATKHLLDQCVDSVCSADMTITVMASDRRDGNDVYSYTGSRFSGLFREQKYLKGSNIGRASTSDEACIPIPYRVEGLNDYTGVHNAAAVFTFNPSAELSNLLKVISKQWALAENALESAYVVSNSLIPTLQQVSRTSIRDPASTHPVAIAVLDQERAEFIQEHYPYAKIDTSHMMTVRTRRVDRKKPTWHSTLVLRSCADKKRWQRAKEAYEKENKIKLDPVTDQELGGRLYAKACESKRGRPRKE